MIRSIETAAQVARLHRVFRHLRPHLDPDDFVAQVDRQRRQGYVLVAHEDAGGEYTSGAGFRVLEFLAWGRVLYVDDFVTHPDYHGRGHGGQVLDWVIAHARALGCEAVHLDTGYARHDAHRLYLRKGFRMTCHHMQLDL